MCRSISGILSWHWLSQEHRTGISHLVPSLYQHDDQSPVFYLPRVKQHPAKLVYSWVMYSGLLQGSKEGINPTEWKELEAEKEGVRLAKHPPLSTLLPWGLSFLPIFPAVQVPYAKQLSCSVRSARARRCRGLHYVLRSFQHSEPKDFFCSSDQPCSDAYLKIRQTLNFVLPLEGIAASSFQTASSVLQGIGILVSAPI